MIEVPGDFAAWRARVNGEAGRRWVESLPELVERLAVRWQLTVDDAAVRYGALSLVVLVRRGGQPLVLRIGWPEETTVGEIAALRAWDGHGVMALHDADPETGALLLERLDHDRSLHTLPIEEAAEVAGALIRTLAVPAPAGVNSLCAIAAGISERLIRRDRALGSPIPRRWVEAAHRYAAELGPAGERVLVHADLHYGNVLAAVREPWLAVDPRAVHGAPEYSVPELMWTRADDLRADADVRHLLRTVVEAGRLDAEIAYGWVVARCADYWLWGLEHGLTVDPVRCERVLSALAPLATRGLPGGRTRRR
ncbi:aminoglycoside phosphotransferase family protein [Actinoplanes sp. NPDC051861]|uniref:aminoglycoside phosphotransferase family protein n=1 Tax=Actinoplanes sp. NPDC051861 TaxID=3155170 RepID=UPI0034447359